MLYFHAYFEQVLFIWFGFDYVLFWFFLNRGCWVFEIQCVSLPLVFCMLCLIIQDC